jgi:hypothetical protein
MHYKDLILEQLSQSVNVAQFISFAPDLSQRFARVLGFAPNFLFSSLNEAIATILRQSSENSLNVRSFHPQDPKNKEFKIGFKKVDEVENHVRRLAKEGLYTIVNETIDPSDGGVSGVLLGDIIEFSPDATPRCVDIPGFGTAALSRHEGIRLLEMVYGVPIDLKYPTDTRVEFSIHPTKRGFLNQHTIIWEIEQVGHIDTIPDIRWPNNFSRLVGDKTYGLLIAHLIGAPVPKSMVISRRVSPFQFGNSTGVSKVWVRTCPRVQVPGKYSTYSTWHDPFELMSREDPTGEEIAAIIVQEEINALYSGSLIVTTNNSSGEEKMIIEGTEGYGDKFMLGIKEKTPLPKEIIDKVISLYHQIAKILGPIRMEWVADLEKVWVVQLHKGITKSSSNYIYPGNPLKYHKFFIQNSNSLEELRELVNKIKDKNEGIILVGNVGITSHFGDVLRSAEIPSKIEFY